MALGCDGLVLEVCLLVGVNDATVSVPMLDALAAAVVGEGMAGLCVLYLSITVHWRHLMDLDRGFGRVFNMNIHHTCRKVML